MKLQLLKLIYKLNTKFFKKFKYYFIIIIVTGIMGVALYYSILLPKIISIIIMTLATAISTSLLIKHNSELFSNKESNNLKDNLDKKNTLIKNLESSLSRALETTIKVDSISDIQQVSLKEVTLKITDYKEKEISNEGIGFNYFGKVQVIEYKGVLFKTIIAKYGLDLTKLKILHKDGEVYVANYKPIFIGFTKNLNEWKLRELRKRIEKGDEIKKYEVLVNASKIVTESETQEKELMDRILNGTELGEMTTLIEDANKLYILDILEYLKMDIIFVDEIESYIEGIYPFIEEFKKDVRIKINELS